MTAREAVKALAQAIDEAVVLAKPGEIDYAEIQYRGRRYFIGKPSEIQLEDFRGRRRNWRQIAGAPAHFFHEVGYSQMLVHRLGRWSIVTAWFLVGEKRA